MFLRFLNGTVGNNFGGIERPREDVDVMWGTNPAASVETKSEKKLFELQKPYPT